MRHPTLSSFSRLLWLLWVFCGSIEFQDYLFYFCENGDCSESIECFGQYGHFNNINSSIHKYRIYFHLFVSSISFIKIVYFHCRDRSRPWLNVFLRTLLFLVLLLMGQFSLFFFQVFSYQYMEIQLISLCCIIVMKLYCISCIKINKQKPHLKWSQKARRENFQASVTQCT